MDEITNTEDAPASVRTSEMNTADRFKEGSPFRRLIDDWQVDRKDAVHRRIAESSAATSRMKYRIANAAKGKGVRNHTYHDHAPRQPDESREEYERRIHRDAQRARRHASSKPSRGWTDLSTMTAEEKAEHRRVKANARKANERRRKAEMQNNAAPFPDVAEIHPDDDSWGMF